MSFCARGKFWEKEPHTHSPPPLSVVGVSNSKHHKYFETLKEKLSTAPILDFPYLKQPFEIQTNVRVYSMGVVFRQSGKPICYHSETFTQVVINYPTFDKELYGLVQSVNKWTHYLMGKETIIHTYHQPLQYLQSQTKLQHS
jgi:hypothetical protein